MRNRTRQTGFTLIEVLVVVAILGVLASIGIPQFAIYRARGFNARVESDARNAATAEEAYYVDFLVYHSGACGELPGFTPSDGVICTTAGDATAFSVSASHPGATLSCTWTSVVGLGPNLDCS